MFIAATYLASILLLQTISVFLTVIYLDMFHKPETQPVPGWLQAFAMYVLEPITCVTCRKGNQTRVSPERTETTENDEESNFKARDIDGATPLEKDDGRTTSASTVGDILYSWKEIVALLDRATMYLYLVFISTGSIALVCVLLVNYSNS